MKTETDSSKMMAKSFYKSDFFKIATAVVITSMIFLIYIYNITERTPPVPLGDPNKLISFKEAQTLIQEYNNDGHLKTLDENNNVRTLEGFMFSRSVLETILHSNKVRSASGKIQSPDSILFYLGQEGTFQDNTDSQGQQPYPIYRLIAIGVKNNSLMIPTNAADYSNANTSSIYDKARPCPGLGCPPPPPPPLSSKF